MATNNNDNSMIDMMKERNEQTLSDIENLQKIEKELYTTLESGVNNLTADQKQKLVDRISEIFQLRTNLYANLSNMVEFYTANQQSVQNTYKQQIVAIKIVEDELANSREKLKKLQEDKSNKLRLVEINTYYGKSYNAKTYIMKIIVYMCIPILLLAVLNNNGIIPSELYGFISIIIMVVGIYFIGAQLIDITNRDKMNYDEYDWKFNKSQAPDDSSGSNSSNSGSNAKNPWITPTVTCVGQSCCPPGSGLIYDSTLNVCLSDSKNSKESMANMTFSKYAMNNPLPSTYLSNKAVQPYSQKYNKYVSV
jgi:hypothetical protein